MASRGLYRPLDVGGAAVRREAGEGAAFAVGQLAGLTTAAATATVSGPAVQTALVRAGRRRLPVGGAEQVQAVLAVRCVDTVARREVLHGGPAPGKDGFEGGGPQHALLHVLVNKRRRKEKRVRSSQRWDGSTPELLRLIFSDHMWTHPLKFS